LIRDLAAATAYKFGDIVYPHTLIDKIVSNSCRLVIMEHEETGLPYYFRGSCTLVTFNNCYYVIMTRHQLGIAPDVVPCSDVINRIRPLTNDTKSIAGNIPIEFCNFERSNPSLEFHDLLFFKVQSSWDEFNQEKCYFSRVFDFTKHNKAESLLVGCPMSKVDIEAYYDAFYDGKVGPIHVKSFITACDFDHSFNSEYYSQMYNNINPEIELNGFSGGAVFSLISTTNGREAVFDGIVLRGGNGLVRVVDSNYILKVLRIIDSQS